MVEVMGRDGLSIRAPFTHKPSAVRETTLLELGHMTYSLKHRDSAYLGTFPDDVQMFYDITSQLKLLLAHNMASSSFARAENNCSSYVCPVCSRSWC